MRILHTADWHLGARLIERDRLSEHAVFLDSLVDTLRAEKIDALLISGDVFDAANPPQDAVALYFDFIKRLADLQTVRVIITGGNHDSASHLNAPRELLRRFNIHVFGDASGHHLVDLGDVVVAAVPFLRERDLRQSTAGETLTTVEEQIRSAIGQHYAVLRTSAAALANGRPTLAMGHLTVIGTSNSESERDIHIGNLGAVSVDTFAGFDYTALGHLHRPQRVAGLDRVRYSGSPIPLSFSEANDAKSMVLLDTEGMKIETIPVSAKQTLVRIMATRSTLTADLEKVPSGSWAEVTVHLTSPEPDLVSQVREAAGSRFEVLKVVTQLPVSESATWQSQAPTLQDLQPRDVFRALLTERTIESDELNDTFEQLLALREAHLTA
jgi:DNA repair protein SbcD/Mre11